MVHIVVYLHCIGGVGFMKKKILAFLTFSLCLSSVTLPVYAAQYGRPKNLGLNVTENGRYGAMACGYGCGNGCMYGNITCRGQFGGVRQKERKIPYCLNRAEGECMHADLNCSLEGIRPLSDVAENDFEFTTYEVLDDISYSYEDKDTSKIEQYIISNIDPDFDIENFNVYDDLTIQIGSGNRGSVCFVLKKGEFETDFKYRALIYDNKVMRITKNGEPDYTSKAPLDDEAYKISDEELYKIALKYVYIDDEDEIVERRVSRRFDYEPYCTVSFSVKRDVEGRLEVYQYRFSSILK